MMSAVLEAPPAGYKEGLDDNLDLEGAGTKVVDVVTPLSAQHVVFLDVDGVVNDLVGIGDPHIYFDSHAHGNTYTIRMPENIIEPVQHLVEHYEVHWLTTWREWANNEIAEHLGIEPLPVITDGTQNRSVGWKWKACVPTAKQALDNGKRVFWIEDFYGDLTGRFTNEVFMDDRFQFVDTWGCLEPHMLKSAGLM